MSNHHHSSATPAATSTTTDSASSSSSSSTQTTTVQSMDTQFEPLDIIGTGSFGIIRKVKRLTDGLILARKELNYGRMDERDLRQLGEEVNILQNLRGNEHIVKYFERYVDKQNFMLYILMEFCSQGDLAGVISRCRRDQVHLSEDTIWSYLAQITTALSDCHSSEVSVEDQSTGQTTSKKKPIILHRDIKPENVFLNHFGLVKLGDFGLSKAMEMAAFTNTYVGTPYYMSPELINGQQYDVKSDIWALGCLIYELCAWHPPFHQAQTQPELAKLIREGKIPNLPRGYSSQLTALIKSMLRQDPKLRPDAKTILSVEQVKHQIRVLEVHRYARELTKKQTQLEEREKLLDEREIKIKSRETKLQKEKDYFKTQQENHLILQEEFQSKFQNALHIIETANLIEKTGQVSKVVDDDENLNPGLISTGDEPDESSRRAPLTERRLSFNPPALATNNSATSSTPTLSYVHAKRMSFNKPDSSSSNLGSGAYGSPMKLDTPFKHLASLNSDPAPGSLQQQSQPPNSNSTTASTIASGPKAVRLVKSSKSLASLKTTSSFLSKLKSNEETESITTNASDDHPSSTKQSGERRVGGVPGSRRLSRRSESANGMISYLGPPSSNQTSRRPTSTIGTASTVCGSGSSGGSNELISGDVQSIRSSTDHLHPPGSLPATAQPIGSKSPKYNHSDPDSLPSPFLKKKSSASALVSHFLRPNGGIVNTAPSSPRKQHVSVVPSRTQSVDTVGLGIKHRIPGMLSHIRSNQTVPSGQPPPVAARPAITTSKRTSLINNNSNSNNQNIGHKPSFTSRFLSGGGGGSSKNTLTGSPEELQQQHTVNKKIGSNSTGNHLFLGKQQQQQQQRRESNYLS
ncbi:NEK protein kinase [Phakopsora pachyrhizi]|nr:NEK protein kinase [Phakopsora pachyrhizi]